MDEKIHRSPDYQLFMFRVPESFRGGCSFGGLKNTLTQKDSDNVTITINNEKNNTIEVMTFSFQILLL